MVINTLDTELTKEPPQSIDHEIAILGSIILERNSFYSVCDILKPETFYKIEHEIIYRTIQSIFERGLRLDLLTLKNELQNSKELEKIGGAYYLSTLTDNVVSSAYIVNYAHIINEKFISRQLIKISLESIESAYNNDSDTFDLLNDTLSKLNSITDNLTENNAKTSKQIVKEIYEGFKSPDTIHIKSKFQQINELIGDYEGGNVYIDAGRPGHGKSVMAIQEARFIAAKIPVLYFSLEMTRAKLILRVAADIAEIPNYRLIKNQIFESELEKFDAAMGYIEKLNLYINDKPNLTISQIYLISKKMVMQYEIGMIFIDHFHLIKNNGKDKLSGLEYNSKMLKVIAKDLKLPVKCLFQMSREQEKRSGSKKPKLSDLREVGEQDADAVNFITRPELMDVDSFSDGSSTTNRIILNNLKNRDGNAGSEIIFNFNGDFQRIYE